MPSWLLALTQLISLLPQIVTLVANVVKIIHGSPDPKQSMASIKTAVANHDKPKV